MYLSKLNLNYFRNYIQSEINFSSNKIIILGNNAQGKSNLLEAIQLLSCLKSHRTNKDLDLVYRDRIYGEIKGEITRNYADYSLSILFPAKGKRELKVNYEKISRNIDFLGIVNTVLFSSLDLDLVKGSPEYRRNWVDNLLLQLEPVFSYIIKEYNHVLKQRNSLLKRLKKQGITNYEDLSQTTILELNIWENKLIENACRVMRRRKRVLDKLEPLARLWHDKISNKTEKLEIIYHPNVTYDRDDIQEIKQKIQREIEDKRNTELLMGVTLVGPHRDEIEFVINKGLARNYGSQGQQRTLVLSLKLGELQLIEQIIGETPLLLLDDVMAELDLQRQQQLLDCLGNRFQTFITTTHLNYFDEKLLQEAQIIRVEKGKIV
ncbi:DNA replication/repair protein RecF [Cyanobacterium aponinum]|uniref:DNA replication/repair protein RecF n=1 Tax=Cyanobacterium aponinum TaxID=379064 RepID=UPI000C12D288|nr:DNA replication/repair protein RecF [Cyanobacterium aponinum]PHV63858.1 DNA replication/repair protein RecF [Cyanobacterium aponinum IPPAS B-1201]